MGFSNYGQLVTAINSGQTSYTIFRKVPNASTLIGGAYFDYSMVTGIPLGQYYASIPLQAQNFPISRSINYGGNVSPQSRFLKSLSIMSSNANVPGSLMLCDYLLYYPFFDMSITSAQTMDNSQASLQRYTNGNGVQLMAVTLATPIGGNNFQVTYTNQAGVSGQVTQPVTNSAQAISQLQSRQQSAFGTIGPFVPLATGDTGIQSIQSAQMSTPDSGLLAFVLIKPLANLQLRDGISSNEIDYFKDKIVGPQIFDGAFLNILFASNNGTSGDLINGELVTVWN